MKYNININQYGIVEKLKLPIDLTDAVVLDYIYWICASVSEKIQAARINNDGRVYTWVNYNHFFSENPILRIKSKGFLTARIDRLEKLGLIQTFITSGYYRRKYVCVTSLTEQIYSNTTVKRELSDIESCSLCDRSDLPLNNHHYEKGTDKTIRVCTDCHTKIHLTTPVHKKEQPVHTDKQLPVLQDERIIILDNNYTKNIYSHEEYLIKIPDTELIELSKKYNCDRTQIVAKGDQLYHWLQSNGKKKYKNFRSLLMGALSRDYGLRPTLQGNPMMI